jgi:hypothetical protein
MIFYTRTSYICAIDGLELGRGAEIEKCHFRHFRLLTPQKVAPITRLTAEDCGAARRQRLKQASEKAKKFAISGFRVSELLKVENEVLTDGNV